MSQPVPIEASRFVRVDVDGLDMADAYRLVVGSVVPRPIAWVTTQNAQGHVNAAPFSSYNYVATDPPMLAINIAERGDNQKDTARNITASGEFVVNVATEDNMELMHKSAAEYPHEISEPIELEIPLLPSVHVAPPRIAISPIHFECKLDQIVHLGNGTNRLYIGKVVAFHLSTDVYDGRNVDAAEMRPVARLGGPYYAALGEIFLRPMLQKTLAS